MVARMRLVIVFMLLTVTLYACGGKPLKYSDSKEQKPGPGLFSGEDGVFTLIKIDNKGISGEEQFEAGKSE